MFNQSFKLPSERVANTEESRLPLPRQIQHSHVPDIRATVARLRSAPPPAVPNIKTTAARLRFSAESDPSNLQMTSTPRVDIKATAQTLRNETVTVFVPEIRSMARDLRLYADAVEVCENEGRSSSEDKLTFTEVMQTSFEPKATYTPQKENCTCSRVYEKEIAAIKSKRRNQNRSRKMIYGQQAKLLVTRIHSFFKELKRRLKGTCFVSMFNSPREMTALACGMSKNTVTNLRRKTEGAGEPQRRKLQNRKAMIQAALRMHEEKWGDTVKEAIHSRLRDERDVTMTELHEDLSQAYEDFDLSRATLHRLVRGLGFSFRKNNRQRFIFERSDLVAKRAQFLRAVASARARNEYLVYIDETWIYSGMTKKKGWDDNNIPRFATRSTFDRYSHGKTVGKNKGKRGIVIAAITEDGIIPECTRIVVSGMRNLEGDYHEDMDHILFESWLKGCLPHMKRWARDRRVCLIMDNAPYHTRQEEKVPTRSSTKGQIAAYLEGKGVAVLAEDTKADLLRKLDIYAGRMGGMAALRRYVTERICGEFNVNLIRLPPFHCFFNPIESCWSQLKAHLNKYGRTTDRIQVVKERTHAWLANVTARSAAAWFRDARREEEAAWEKEMLDREEQGDTSSMSTDTSEESVSDDSDVSATPASEYDSEESLSLESP